MTKPVIIGNAALYLGDCMEILPALGKIGAVITDPPYFYENAYLFPANDVKPALDPLIATIKSFVFYACSGGLLGSPSSVHVWHKSVPIHPHSQIGNVAGNQYERIAEYNGGKKHEVFRAAAIMPNFAACAAEYVDHPTQKPLSLCRKLVQRTKGLVLDPFMGSGTTGVACVQVGRSFVGIEIDPRYFAIACERIENAQRQERLFA